MSPTVDNFVHDLVAMAKAYDTLPGLEAENKQLQEGRLRDGETIARLETRIMDLKAQQDETLAKLRSVEAERDEAGFRQLEAEDKVANLVRSFQVVQVSIGQAVAAATGSAQHITVMMSEQETGDWEAFKIRQEREALEQAWKAQEEARLAMEEAARPKPEAVVDFPTAKEIGEDVAFGYPKAEGQSEANPSQEASLSAVGNDTTNTVQTGAGSEPAHGKYFGKRYHDWNYYVPLASWLEGGGTEEDYNWRPAAFGGQR